MERNYFVPEKLLQFLHLCAHVFFAVLNCVVKAFLITIWIRRHEDETQTYICITLGLNGIMNQTQYFYTFKFEGQKKNKMKKPTMIKRRRKHDRLNIWRLKVLLRCIAVKASFFIKCNNSDCCNFCIILTKDEKHEAYIMMCVKIVNMNSCLDHSWIKIKKKQH